MTKSWSLTASKWKFSTLISPKSHHMIVMFMNEVSLEGDVLDFTIYIQGLHAKNNGFPMVFVMNSCICVSP